MAKLFDTRIVGTGKSAFAFMQGYYFSPPIAAEQFLSMLREDKMA